MVLSAPGPAARGADASDSYAATEERFRYAATDREFLVLRDGVTGRKLLQRADGVRFDSVEDAVRLEESGLSALRRVVAPELWSVAEDPSRSEEPVRAMLVLRSQPVHEAAGPIRERVRASLRPRLERLRGILGAIVPRRDTRPGERPQIGEVQAEEDRILTMAEGEEVRSIRAEVRNSVRAMRQEILEAARPLAEADQDAVSAFLESLPGARVTGRTLILSTVSAILPAGRLRDVVEGLPAVARVLPDRDLPPTLDQSVAVIGGSSWTNAGYSGGSGVMVALMDSGVDDAHPALSGAVSASKDFADAGTTDDTSGHGTHIAGIVASRDSKYRGVAPGALILNAKIGVTYLSPSGACRGGDWAAGLGADVFNWSFGGYGDSDGTNVLALFADAAVAELGISVASAAANNGEGVSDPLGPASTAFNSLCVGDFRLRGTPSVGDDVMASSSSRGPCSDGRRKPDLAAPGEVVSTYNGWEGANPDFVWLTGTSMASPHVAGSLAVLIDYAASWAPEGEKALLLATTWNGGNTPLSWDKAWGWGAIDLGSAYLNRATVHEGVFADAGPSVAWLTAPGMAAGGNVALAWNRQVTWNGPDFPTTYKAITDLDLEVYGSDGSLQGTSTALLESVERVTVPSSTSGTVIRVTRSGAFPSGQTSVGWAVATEAGGATSEVPVPDPPSLSCSIALEKAIVKTGEIFTVEASVSNDGGLAAYAPECTLTLPVGFTIVSGNNPETVSTPYPGETKKAVWTVRAEPGEGGTKALEVRAVSNSFGGVYTAGPVSAVLDFDADSPWGECRIAGNAVFTAGPSTVVDVVAHPGADPVTEMRVRNAGAAFGPWIPFDGSFPWTLSPGTGPRTVEVQLRDAAGRESVVFGDTVYSDVDPPSGSFALSGGAEYLMPWEPLTADVAAGDGGGSGVAGFLLRWQGESVWSAILPFEEGDQLPLERPATEDARAEGQFVDLVGNRSPLSAARIRLIPGDPPTITRAKSFRGRLLPGGVGGVFRTAGLPADRLTVQLLHGEGRDRTPLEGVIVDLWDSSRAKAIEGESPAGRRGNAIEDFALTVPGDHWIVLRPTEEVPSEGIPFTLKVRLKKKRSALHLRGIADSDGTAASIPVPALDGMELRGKLIAYVTEPPTLHSPEGAEGPLAVRELRQLVYRVDRTALTGGSGMYRIVIPGAAGATYDLRLHAPRRRDPGAPRDE